MVASSSVGSSEGETRLFDLPLEIAYRYTLWENPRGLTLRAGPEVGVWLPLSETSEAQGVDARWIMGLTLLGGVPLGDGDFLTSFFVALRGSYGHTFSDGGLTAVLFEKDGQTFSGPTASSSDTFNDGGRFLAPYRDAVEVRLDMDLALHADLSFGLALGLGYLAHDGDATLRCAESPSGTCEREGGLSTQTFGVSLSYAVKRLLGFALAYENASQRLGEDGEARSLLGGPEATYSLTTTLLLDGLHARAIDGTKPSR